MKLVIFFAITTLLPINALDLPIISDIQDIISIANDISDINAGNIPFKQLLTDGSVASSNPLLFAVQLLDNLDVQIGTLESVFQEKVNELLDTILARVPLEGKVDRGLEEFHSYISRIEYIYRHFEYYSRSMNKFNNFAMDRFINIVTTSELGGIQDLLSKINGLFVPEKSANIREGLIPLLIERENMHGNEETCDRTTSLHQELYDIYRNIAITEMRAYAMTIYAYKYIATQENVTVGYEVEKVKAQYIIRMEDYLLELHKHIGGTSRALFRCDPSEYIEGEAYVSFKGLFQVMLLAEWQLFTGDTCYYACGDGWTYYHRDISIPSENAGWWKPQKRCKGLLTDCEWVGSEMLLCESSDNSWRRLEWVRTESFNGGDRIDCVSLNGTYWNIYAHNNDIWHSCHNCGCVCSEEDAETPVNRTISLRPQISNIADNMIVTNIKFTLKDKMIHMQIEEGRIITAGQLEKNTSHWVDLEDFQYEDDGDDGRFYLLKEDEKVRLKRSVDFMFVQRRGQRRYLHLDDIIAPYGYVVTGVRLNHEDPSTRDEKNDSPLQLEIYVTPYEFTTGKLVPTNEEPSYWITPKNQPHPPHEYESRRTKIDKGGRVDYWPAPSIPNIAPNQWLRFEESFWRSDVGQTTIPFIDIRPAVLVGTPLNGVGFSYRSYQDYIGFIALKVFSLSMVDFVDPTMTNNQWNHYKRLYRKPTKNQPTVVDKLPPKMSRRGRIMK